MIGRKLSLLIYADDMVLISRSSDGLQKGLYSFVSYDN